MPDLAVDLKLGGTWTDITDDVRVSEDVTITRGRSAEGVRTDPGSCTLTLDNRSGKYSPRHPESALYGLIGRNAPIRISIRAGGYLDVAGAGCATTPDTAALDITGDLDVRVDVTSATLWSATQDEVIGKYNNVGVDQRSWRLVMVSRRPRLVFSPDGTGPATLTSPATADLPTTLGDRIALRVTLDVDNGSAGHTVTFYWATTLAGPWTQLGAPVVTAGTTALHSGTAPLQIGATANANATRPTMRVHAAEVRSGIGGTVVAAPVFTALAAGTTAWSDSAGRAWTITAPAVIDNRWPRFTGEVSSWPTRWSGQGEDVYTPIEAAGILRRLGQGRTQLKSPMRREFANPSRSGIVAYWPCEDGSAATVLAAAEPSEPPLVITGDVEPAEYDGWRPSDPIPVYNTGSAAGPLPTYTPSGQHAIRLQIKAQAAPATEQSLLAFSATGTGRLWALSLMPSGNYRIRAFNAAGGSAYDSGEIPFFNSLGHDFQVLWELTESAGNVNWYLGALEYELSGGSVIGGTFQTGTAPGLTVGQLTALTIGADRALGDVAIGHVVVANSLTAYDGTGNALIGWVGETAAARIARLGREEGLPVLISGVASASIPLGVQPRATLLALLEMAAEADGGILAEQLGDVGLIYRTRATLYNQLPRLELDFGAPGEVPLGVRPEPDDFGVTNDVTVERTDGSSARAVRETGPLSYADPPAGVGRYEDNPELNLRDDGQLPHVAGWLLHLGTWDESRWPLIPLDLAAGPHLIPAVLALALGDRLTIEAPHWLQPDPIDQLVQGLTETIGAVRWSLNLTCRPAGPWRTAVIGSAETSRLDTAGSQLASGISSSATTLSVATAGLRWTTDPAHFPLDIGIGGERITVTAIAGTASPQSFTVTRSTNGVVKSHSSAAPVRLWQPMTLGL